MNKLGTKAETLQILYKQLKYAKVLPQYTFTVKEWKKHFPEPWKRSLHPMMMRMGKTRSWCSIQPKSNRGLAKKIIDAGGCILSEYPIGTSLAKYQYVERDRLQSGVSQGVLIVEAERKSGTMHTAEFAVKQYKRLACYYHKLLEMSSGNQYLEDSGRAVNIRGEEEVLAFARELPLTGSYQQMSLF